MSDDVEPRVRAIELWRRDVDQQVGRLVSDVLSEKATRGRTNDSIDARLAEGSRRFRSIEKVLYTFVGVCGVLQVLVISILLIVVRKI